MRFSFVFLWIFSFPFPAPAANEAIPDNTYVLLEHQSPANPNPISVKPGERLADSFTLHRYSSHDGRWFLVKEWGQTRNFPVKGPYRVLSFGNDYLVTGMVASQPEAMASLKRSDSQWDTSSYAFRAISWKTYVPILNPDTGWGRILAFVADGAVYRVAVSPSMTTTVVSTAYAAIGQVPAGDMVSVAVATHASAGETLVFLQKDQQNRESIVSGEVINGYRVFSRQPLPPGTLTANSRVLASGETIWISGANYQGRGGSHYLRYKLSKGGRIVLGGAAVPESTLSVYPQSALAIVSESGSLLVGDEQGDFFQIDASGKVGLQLTHYLPYLSTSVVQHSIFKHWQPSVPVSKIAHLELPTTAYQGPTALFHLVTHDPKVLAGVPSGTNYAEQFVKLLSAEIRKTVAGAHFDATISSEVGVEVFVDALNNHGRTTFDAIQFAVQRDANVLAPFHFYDAGSMLKVIAKGQRVDLRVFAKKVIELLELGCANHLLDKVALLQSH